MCLFMFVVLLMFQNCIMMVLVCMEFNYIELIFNKNLLKVMNNISGRVVINVNIDINGFNLFLYCWFIKILWIFFFFLKIWNICLEGDVRSQVLMVEFYVFFFIFLIGGYLFGKFSVKRVMIFIIFFLVGFFVFIFFVLIFNFYIVIGFCCVFGLLFVSRFQI